MERVEELAISNIVRAVLANRGIIDEQVIYEFLHPNYDGLHDPFLLPDLRKAVRRIEEALTKKQKIVIYGDYDIDGLSAAALLLDALKRLGARVDSYIPDRFEEGYGINSEALRKLKKNGADLIITVDCGSTSIEPITEANRLGLEVIVTDHHEVGKLLPPAVAVVNPKRQDSEYPFRDLAGTGVAFKLACALLKDNGESEQEKWLLDLVALGTVCDVVGLTDENRTLVYYGLKVLAKTKRVGLRELAKVSGFDLRKANTYHLGFLLGPRLNAAGRLEHAKQSLELLTTDNIDLAKQIATKLDSLNYGRRSTQDVIYKTAIKEADKFKNDKVLVLANKDWSHGIVGIVASKLVEKYKKPVVLLQILGKESKGSARSLGEFNIVEAFSEASSCLLTYGGHHFAAGCTIKTELIDDFRQVLNDRYQALGLKNQARYFKVKPDVILDNFADLSWELYHQLCLLEPFGNSHGRPTFKVKGIEIQDLRKVGADRSHLKLFVRDRSGRTLDGIGFGLANRNEQIVKGALADIVFELDENNFNGRRSLQLVIRHIKP